VANSVLKALLYCWLGLSVCTGADLWRAFAAESDECPASSEEDSEDDSGEAVFARCVIPRLIRTVADSSSLLPRTSRAVVYSAPELRAGHTLSNGLRAPSLT